MPTFANARTGWGLDGPTVAAQDARLQLASSFLTGATSAGGGTTGIAARQGVRPGLGSPLLVVAASGMNVTVNAGVAFIQGTAAINSGMYTACLDSNATLTVSASNVTNPRIDNVIARVVDNGNNTSTTTVELTTGTAAPSPVQPALPANSLLLANIAVAANASSITSANITDRRVATAAMGGIIPVVNSTDQPQASSEFPAYRHRRDVGVGSSSPLEWSTNGTTWTPVGTAPAMVKLSSTTAATSASTTLNAPSFSTVGYSSIYVTWFGKVEFGAGSPVGMRFNGDTGSNYSWQTVESGGGAASAQSASTDTNIYAGYAHNNNPSNYVGGGTMTIINAASSTTNKTASGNELLTADVGGGGNGFGAGALGGMWNNTAALTSIGLVSTTSKNFSIGTTINVYALT